MNLNTLGKINKIILSLLVFVFSFIRIVQIFSSFGNDFYSTLENYPFEIADGYGLYYHYAYLLGIFQIPFPFSGFQYQ